MKLLKVIDKANMVRPNDIDDEVKAEAVQELEAEYAESMGIDLPESTYPQDKDLLMPDQFSDSYVWYVCAKLDLIDCESDKYMADITMANAEISKAKAWWRRNNSGHVSGRKWKVM